LIQKYKGESGMNRVRSLKKKMMYFLVLVSLIALIVSGCSSSSSNSNDDAGEKSDKKYKIQLSYHVPKNHYAHAASEKFKKLAEERSNGQLEVTLFPGGQLGGLRDNTEGVKQGTIEMAWSDIGTASVFFPKSGIISLPFLFRDFDHVENFYDGPVGQKLLDELREASGIRFIGMVHSGFRSIISNKPIKSVEDMKGLKLRVPEIPMYTRFAELVGSSPTPIPGGEVYTSLQTGVVEGAELPANYIYDTSLFEVTKYITHTYHIYTDYDLAINDQFFTSLPKDLQEIITTSAQEVAVETRKIVRDETIDYEKKLEEKLELTTVDRGKFQEKMKPLWDEFAKENNAEQLIEDIVNIK
jgi:TRAP-type transport system periplasmic protein